MKFLVRRNGGKPPLEVSGKPWEWEGILFATHHSLDCPKLYVTSAVLQGIMAGSKACKTMAEAETFTREVLDLKGVDHVNNLLVSYDIINADVVKKYELQKGKKTVPDDGITYYRARARGQGYAHLKSFLFVKIEPNRFFVHSHSACTQVDYYRTGADVHYSKDELAGVIYRFDEKAMEVAK